MKRLFKWLLIICIYLIATYSYGYDDEKVVRRQFNVTPQTLIDVNNKFGKVHINTWNKNEVHVNITIMAKGKNDQRLQDILESIKIDFDEKIDDDYLGIKTRIGNTGKNSNFNIDYVIDMPIKNKLKLENSFGDVYVSDLNAASEIDVKYGLLKAENLYKPTEINLSFGNAMSSINSVTEAMIDIKYSKLHIDKAQKVELNSQFSDVEFNTVDNLNIQMKYGKLSASQLNSVVGEQQFSEFRTEQLNKALDLELKHNKLAVSKVNPSVSSFNVVAEFSNMEVNIDDQIKARFEMDFSFCDLKYSGDDIDFYYINRETNHSKYKGYISDKNASAKFTVDSKYGDLRLGVMD